MQSEDEILIVEDSPTQAAQLQYLLESSNYKVRVAVDAARALQMIAEKMPDLIISDIMMPEMNGFELCKTFKERNPEIPFIILTQLSSPEDIIQGIQSRADSFIVKPFEKNFMLTRINELLENFRLRKDEGSCHETPFKAFFNGSYYDINSNCRQIFDLLISTFDSAFQQNKELLKTQQQIRNMVDELELRNQELENAQAELLRSNEALKRFSTVISHDLNEPLRGVNQYAKLLDKKYKGKLDDDADAFIHYIVDGSQRMQTMILSLLDFSRVGYYKRTLFYHNLNSIMEHTIGNLTALIEETKAKITYVQLPEAKVDASLIIQLLQNLIINGIKYSGGNIPEIHIGVERQDDLWQFSVKDNGIGIEEKNFARIFNIFDRLHTQEEISGTGIGLSLCKEIVECHKGKMWLESEINQGSTFFFTLPV